MTGLKMFKKSFYSNIGASNPIVAGSINNKHNLYNFNYENLILFYFKLI